MLPSETTREKPTAAIGGPVEHRRHHRSRLRHEREVAGSRREVREAGVDAARRHHESDAVGAHDAQAARASRVEHRALERGPVRPTLAKPGRQDDRGARAALGELADDLGHRRRRRRDHREIGCERQARDVAIDGHAVHRLEARMHRQDRPVEAGAEQVVGDGAPDRAFALARSDQRDRARREESVEAAEAHPVKLSQPARRRPRALARTALELDARATSFHRKAGPPHRRPRRTGRRWEAGERFSVDRDAVGVRGRSTDEHAEWLERVAIEQMELGGVGP